MTSSRRWYILSAILIVFIFTFSSCDTQPSVGISDSLDVVADLELIEGAENSTVTVNKGTSSYFSLNVSNIAENAHVQEGTNQKGWCVLWDKPIDSNNSRHDGLALYSTFGDEKWKPVNYLLTIKPQLELQDPDLTYLEIQAAIWTLRDYPKFNVDMSVEQMPSRLVRDGKPNFDKAKVKEIVTHVNSNYESFQYNGASTYAVIAETPSDTQTIIIEVDQTVWAYGQYSFRSQEYKNAVGATGQGNGRWGWVFELDSDVATTELIAGGGDDDGSKEADEVGTIIGSLDMSKSANTLDITYSPFNNYLISDLHLWVGCSLNEFPTAGNNGNPSLNSFQYTYSGDPEDSKSFSIDLSEIGCSGTVFVAAHAGDLYRVEEVDLPDDPKPVFSITKLERISVGDINDHGQIVGAGSRINNNGEKVWQKNSWNNNSDLNSFVRDSYYWSEETGQIDIGHLDELAYNPGPNTESFIIEKRNFVKDINDNGLVIGFDSFGMEEYICDPYDQHDCYWSYIEYNVNAYTWTLDGGIKSLESLPGGLGEPVSSDFDAGINNEGRKFIHRFDELFQVWNNANETITPTSSTNLIRAKAINNRNSIVGFARENGTRNEVVFILNENNTYQFTDVVSNNYPLNLDINDKGQIVGSINIGDNFSLESRAFYWDEDNGKIFLPSLSSGESEAVAINNNGQIVGYNTDENGNKIPVMWEITNKAPKIASN